MEHQILAELKEIKDILSRITGTSDLPEGERFSQNAIEKAANEYQTMVIQRGEWIKNNDLDDIFKGCYWHPGEFIIEKFGFSNYFKRGKTLYFNKRDLIALKNELKARKIDLQHYIELMNDKEKFEKCIAAIPYKKAKNKKCFNIPEGLQDIETKPYLIAEETIKDEIEKLKKEFNAKKMADYIDIHNKGTYAMFKHQYYFEKYLEPGLRRDCNKWCENFNYANHALQKLAELKKQESEGS